MVRKLKKGSVTPTEDHSFHDIRKLPNLLTKSNITFLEVLFSEDFETYDSDLCRELLANRGPIARMNLPYLYDACRGMFHQENKKYHKNIGTENEDKAFKAASSAMRVSDFMVRFLVTNFNDFKSAIYYGENENARKHLLKVKKGDVSQGRIKFELGRQYEVFDKIKPNYKQHKLDTDTRNSLHEVVQSYVKKNLREELKNGEW